MARRRSARRPGFLARQSPAVYLGGVIVSALAGLAVLPLFADLINAAIRAGSSLGNGCHVVSVIDGDTVSLFCPPGAPERARLMGFDAPELFSPGCPSELALAWRAKWALRLVIWQAGEVEIVAKGRDRYDRRLILMSVDGVSVGQILVAQGLARPYDGGRRTGWCA